MSRDHTQVKGHRIIPYGHLIEFRKKKVKTKQKKHFVISCFGLTN